MVEGVEGLGDAVEVLADLVGRQLLPCALHRLRVLREFQIQGLFRGTAGRAQIRRGHFRAAGFRVFPEDRLDADGGVKDVRTGVSFKGSKAVDVEDVILGRLVRKIAVLQGSQRHHPGGLLSLVLRDLRILRDAGIDCFPDLFDQGLQTHDAAVSRLEGLAVLPVHGAEADPLQVMLRRDDTRLLRHAEELGVVQLLPLVGHVDVAVRAVKLLSLDQSREVAGGIEGRAVRLADDAGREFSGIPGLGDIHHQGAVALVGDAALLQVLDQPGNIRLDITLALPELKGHVQRVVVLLQVRHGNLHDVLPERPVSRVAALQLLRRLVGLRRELRVLLGALRRGRIDLLQLADGEGRLRRVLTGKVRIEVGKVRLPEPELLDDQAHLETPVPEMDVAGHLVPEERAHALQGLADDGAAEMSHVEGLRHVGAAVVHNDLLRGFLSDPVFLLARHLTHCFRQGLRRDLQVDEPGHDSIGCFEKRAAGKLLHHLVRDVDGLFLCFLRAGHGAVALVLAEIRPVRHRDAHVGAVVPAGFKGLLQDLIHLFRNRLHVLLLLPQSGLPQPGILLMRQPRSHVSLIRINRLLCQDTRRCGCRS